MDKISMAKVRSAGRKVLVFMLQRYGYVALIAVVLLAFILWPKTTPKLRGIEPPNEQQAGQPPSTQPVTAQRAADLPLYAPGEAGSDAKWSMPAELKADELQRLAQQVDKLGSDVPATAQLEQQCNSEVGYLMKGEIVGLLWSRLLGKGFHDTNLPLDWYEVVKDQNSVLRDLTVTQVAETFTNEMVQLVILTRLQTIRIRVIGGRVLAGDILFVKSTQAYIDHHRPYYERLLPMAQSVSRRVFNEFPTELGQQKQQ